MWLRRVADATLRKACRLWRRGAVRPRSQTAARTTASNPARCEMSTWRRAEARLCCASESSTTPTTNDRRRRLFADGGGGRAAVVAGTDAVDTGSVVVTRVNVPLVDAIVVCACELTADDGSRSLFVGPPPDETITATIAPASAAIARPTASKAFFTRREATLARNGEARRAAESAACEAGCLPLPRRT